MSLKGKQQSKIGDIWLEYVKHTNKIDNLIKEYKIPHFHFGNNERHKYVDGYDPATNTIYEFLGDYWHGNPKTNGKNMFRKNYATNKTFYQPGACPP